MRYRDSRLRLFQLATSIVFVAAILFQRTQPIHGVEYGTCAENQMNGCDVHELSHDWCYAKDDCTYNTYTEQYDLCYCMSGETDCSMWPGGCS